MNADTVTAICATAIASASFVVSVQQGRASRQHNRHSVRPVLTLWNYRRVGGTTGISLENQGLGPAFVTTSQVWLDQVLLGRWEHDAVASICAELRERPSVVEMNRKPWVLPAGASRFLLSVDNYDGARHSDLWDLIKNRLAMKIVYDSVYGGDAHELAYRMETLAEGTPGL
ncbi:hypothetical protein BIV25_45450 [Streptomyces sp. MUSC 14]|uniref:hypothetical protein n=1 Tax=Streptomyces sp. MUSC 14 TaxID=1354889 RepID=UPI0008F59CDE|nr:hypothetical protein [Streptomyces sp. MUSC 14]OIJ84932.1 hypothetical protein BIV25_45450 [Streptomyces sp. MUSC 14]